MSAIKKLLGFNHQHLFFDRNLQLMIDETLVGHELLNFLFKLDEGIEQASELDQRSSS